MSVVVPLLTQLAAPPASLVELLLPRPTITAAPAAPAATPMIELRNSLRVRLIGTSCAADTTSIAPPPLRRMQHSSFHAPGVCAVARCTADRMRLHPVGGIQKLSE